jgi:hypothetical protein
MGAVTEFMRQRFWAVLLCIAATGAASKDSPSRRIRADLRAGLRPCRVLLDLHTPRMDGSGGLRDSESPH